MQAFAGIVTVSVGHCHPGVVSAVQAQLNKLMHTTTIYLHNEIAQYAKELTDRLPGNLKARFDIYSTCALPALDTALSCAPVCTARDKCHVRYMHLKTGLWPEVCVFLICQ